MMTAAALTRLPLAHAISGSKPDSKHDQDGDWINDKHPQVSVCRAVERRSFAETEKSTGEGSKNKKVEFVLKLSEALTQVPIQPTPDILDFTASTFLIPLEYKMIEGISCPKCSGRSLQEIRRGSLNPRKDLDWPYYCPGGDEYHFRCSTCGYSFPVTFWFAK